jgi:hypothetical protein
VTVLAQVRHHALQVRSPRAAAVTPPARQGRDPHTSFSTSKTSPVRPLAYGRFPTAVSPTLPSIKPAESPPSLCALAITNQNPQLPLGLVLRSWVTFTTPGNRCSVSAEIRLALQLGELFRAHAFEFASAKADIDRLTKPKHPGTDGRVKRMNISPTSSTPTTSPENSEPSKDSHPTNTSAQSG